VTIGIAPSESVHLTGAKLLGLAWGGDLLWASDGATNSIIGVDAMSGAVLERVPCPEVEGDLTIHDSLLYQVTGRRRTITVLDPESGSVVGEIGNPRPGYHLSALCASGDTLWIGYTDRPLADRLALSNHERQPDLHLGAGSRGFALTDSVLIASTDAHSLIAVHSLAGDGGPRQFEVQGQPLGLAWDGTRLWYADPTIPFLRAVEVPGLAAA
jgi:hypothetical protein